MAIEFDMGMVRLSALDDSDFVGVQVDGLGDSPGLPPFELLHPAGFASRPAAPDANGRGSLALYWTEGRDKYAILLADPREASLVPNLRAGERCFYGPRGQFVRMHEDGAISACTTDDGTINGHTLFWKLSPTDGFVMDLPWGRLSFGPNGFHVAHRSGARIDLGAIAGIASPLDALSSYATITAAIASINATAVSQGTDGGAANTAAVTALLALLTTMAASIDAKTGTPSACSVALAAATAAITNLGKVV